ncbi:hypothetical protein [Paraburkholderia sp. SIMBA_054]|uniref:hypothetical protein n=1 Tax=Paraburkholderia sp. SIMBA_054 TaxID=3085795 RepID=UPI003978FAC9
MDLVTVTSAYQEQKCSVACVGVQAATFLFSSRVLGNAGGFSSREITREQGQAVAEAAEQFLILSVVSFRW